MRVTSTSHRGQVRWQDIIFSNTSVHGLLLFLDMLGFKLEMPRREGTVGETVRPIYLDMQVC